MTKQLAYLASPYTHKKKTIMKARAAEIAKIKGRLLLKGLHAYCPIAETVMVAKCTGIVLGNVEWDFWRAHDLNLLSRCDEIWVALMDGVEKSRGVQGEVRWAIQHGIPVKLLNPETLELSSPPLDNILELFGVKFVEELNE